MAENQSSVVINDIPEELKGYRKMLLNAAFGQVFSPDYLKAQMPDATLWNPGGLPPATNPQSPPPTQPAQNTNTHYPTSVASLMGVGDSADAIQEFLEKANRVGYAQGGLASAAAAIEKLLQMGDDVSLGASGTPLGGYTPPMTINQLPNIPYQIGTGTKPPPPPVPPAVTPPANTNGVINTQPSGTLPVGNPNPTPPVHVNGNPTPAPMPGHPAPQPQPQPRPGGGTTTTPMFVANQPANFAGAAQAQQMGYNPAQYADRSVADELAQMMGGRTVYTNSGGPISPPSQAMVDAGGSNMHNAGLIADINKRFADDEGMRKFALNNLREEIRSYGGSTGGFAAGGILKMAEGGMTPSMVPVNPYAPEMEKSNAAPAPTPNPFLMNSTAPSEFDSQPTPSPVLGTGNLTNSMPTPTGMAPGALNPYQAYESQRILGMGNQGQVDPNGNLQASKLTQNALYGYGQMPSYFQNGEIYAGRDSQGRATTPMGIANDTFDTAGNLAINASQLAQDMTWRNPLQSTFGTTLSQIANNPWMFQAGDISLGQLTAPQLDAPMGVSGSQLNSYQMAGPRMIDMNGGDINPNYINSQWLRDFMASMPDQVRGQQYRANTINNTPTIDTRDVTRNFKNAKMMAPDDVRAGQIFTDRFIDSGNPEAYMSPYDRNVIDVQRRDAQRAFDEQKAGRSAAAIKAGAFGGGRQAVAESIADRDLALLKEDITAKGMQSSFNQAQQQYERDRAARMNAGQFNVNARLQGDLANQNAGLQVGSRNLDADLQMNQLMGDIGLRGLLANQAAGLTVEQANQMARNQSGQFNASNRQQAMLANQGANQQTELANLQSRLQTQGLGANLGQQANLANQNAYMDAASKNQGYRFQSQLANQGALQQANQANLGAALGVQELGANQALQAMLANQNAGLTAGQANLGAALQTQGLSRNSGLTAAQANQQTRLSQNTTLLDALAKADQLQQQASQGNVSNQLGALGQQTNSALAANSIGQNRADLGRLAQAQELLRLQSMGTAGSAIDSRSQAALDLGYQDWTNQQNYPYQQMNWLQSILGGVPMGYNQEAVQFQKTNPLSQIAGLGTAALGAYGAYKGQ